MVTDELTDFVRVIRKQYDANTFQLGTLNAEDTFMGKQAYSNTYLAYSGETEVKGFVIGQSVGRVLYVFHFCASYDDYAAMERVMRYMLNSVRFIGGETGMVIWRMQLKTGAVNPMGSRILFCAYA